MARAKGKPGIGKRWLAGHGASSLPIRLFTQPEIWLIELVARNGG
ncbi:hypothetical protein Q9K02_06940 [Qipengyuania sp. G39]|uniref:Transposase n=1 Tax=Qipengyuania profundimaris TaxID=3067652 RepID=A0ABT9HP09_9SPHN|nr:hypothetical protein [Qipengyuania sp. G39]MDP4574872.1 hypothetical protein [Qipengyuania sp. G39]